MPRFSVTLDDDQAEWIRAEAADRDRSQADVIRRCIDAVRSDAVDTDAVDTDAHHIGAVQPDALADLRDRVAGLEDRVDEIARDAELNQQPTPDDSDVLVKDDSEAPPSPPEPQGSDGEEAVVEWVFEHQPVSRQEIVAAFSDRVDERGIKPDSWWRRHARPALEAAEFEYERNVGWSMSED